MDQEQGYQIIITSSAERAYFEVLDYVYEHHPFERASEIALELMEHCHILQSQPYIGSAEFYLSHRKEHYRFLLYQRTERTTVKIIYYVDEEREKIYITDYFPTEMGEQKIKKRTR